MDHVIDVVELTPQPTAVVCGRSARDGVGPFIGQALGEVIAAVGESGVAGPPFCLIDMDCDDFLLEVGFPVTGPVESSGRVTASRLPGGEAATVLHKGPYDAVAAAYAAIEEWMSAHGFVPAGRPWESYLDGPEVAEPRTLVTWPFSRRGS